MSRELAGGWIGRYAYPDDGDAVAFTAELHESAGRFTGSMVETDRLEGRLSAVVEGRRTGSAVRFTKFYETGSAEFDTVVYEGALNPAETEIEGVWSIPGSWSGRFLMVRTPGREADASRRRVAQV